MAIGSADVEELIGGWREGLHDELHGYWQFALAAGGERTADVIRGLYGEDAQHSARQAAEAAELLEREPPDPPTVPDDPARPHCAWCGRNDPPGGLDYFGLDSPPGPREWECCDPESCDAAREQRLPSWREVWGDERGGYRVVEKRPAGLVTRWEYGLDGAEPALRALGEWEAARARPEPPAAENSAPPAGEQPPGAESSAPPPVDVAAQRWSHALSHPANRTHLGGWDHTLRNPAHRRHYISGGAQ